MIGTYTRLCQTADRINELRKELINLKYPNGKPAWMSKEEWENITRGIK